VYGNIVRFLSKTGLGPQSLLKLHSAEFQKYQGRGSPNFTHANRLSHLRDPSLQRRQEIDPNEYWVTCQLWWTKSDVFCL